MCAYALFIGRTVSQEKILTSLRMKLLEVQRERDTRKKQLAQIQITTNLHRHVLTFTFHITDTAHLSTVCHCTLLFLLRFYYYKGRGVQVKLGLLISYLYFLYSPVTLTYLPQHFTRVSSP